MTYLKTLIQRAESSIIVFILFVFIFPVGYFLYLVWQKSNTDFYPTLAQILGGFFATLIGVGLSLYWDRERRKITERKQQTKSYISIVNYVEGELKSNVTILDEVVLNNNKTLKQFQDKFPERNKQELLVTEMAIWQVSAEDLLIGLEDKHHMALLTSRVFENVAENHVVRKIRDVYLSLSDLKRSLRRMSAFFEKAFKPPSNLAPKVNADIGEMLIVMAPEAIRVVRTEIKLFMKQAKVAIKEIRTLTSEL